MKITYNSPVILTFSILAILVLIFCSASPGMIAYFTLSPGFHFHSLQSILTLFTYGLGHVNFAHLVGNLSFILLIGPMVEEKYGAGRLVLMMVGTLTLTALLHKLFFSFGLLGASGIVFMLIILSSLTNAGDKEIPLTFILIAILFIGKEILAAFKQDQISQFAHIFGGICGGLFGLAWRKK